MTHQLQPFWLQPGVAGAGAKLSQIFRSLHQKKVTAVAKGLGGSGKQVLRLAEILPAGEGMADACRTAGKIGGIGNNRMEASIGGSN